MRDPINDPYEMVDKVPHNEFYQRRTDPKRVKEIANFIRTSVAKEYSGDGVATLFPTAMLLAASVDDTNFKVGETVNLEMSVLNENSLYIVDGQHRLMGVISLFNELESSVMKSDEDEYLLAFLKRYMFNCTLLLNFDLWEQAQDTIEGRTLSSVSTEFCNSGNNERKLRVPAVAFKEKMKKNRARPQKLKKVG